VFWKSVTVALESGPEAVYSAVELPLQISQTAAVMEVTQFLFSPLPGIQLSSVLPCTAL